MTETPKTDTPTDRAMKAAVDMEIHAACSTQTIGKARALDEHFPGYDAMREELERYKRRAALPIVDGISLKVATALVKLFGGEETDMTIEFIPEGHSGPGFYGWCTEYPEDGSFFLGPASEFSDLATFSEPSA